MDDTPEKSSEENAQAVQPRTKVRRKLGWARYFSAQAEDFCAKHQPKDASKAGEQAERDPEEYVLRRYRAIIKRAKKSGDLGSEIRAVDKICKIKGIGAVESIKNLERAPMEKLVQQVEAGIKLLGPFMINVLDAKIFEPGVEAIWDHKVSREEAPQYLVECLRISPFLRKKDGAPSKTLDKNVKQGQRMREYWRKRKAEEAARDAAKSVQITVH